MAKCEVKSETVRTFNGVTLELNKEEARALVMVLGLVGGSVTNPRKLTERIWSQLREVPELRYDCVQSNNYTVGQIVFKKDDISGCFPD